MGDEQSTERVAQGTDVTQEILVIDDDPAILGMTLLTFREAGLWIGVEKGPR
ncbi:hypothetical protein [Brevundimonas nasdae]|uniref:hypothetical protein n=1 Tax=Brevundimonas nasdae TaxID=172043 RepID=UPI003F68DD57